MPNFRIVECLPDATSLQEVLDGIHQSEHLETIISRIESGTTARLIVVIAELVLVGTVAREYRHLRVVGDDDLAG